MAEDLDVAIIGAGFGGLGMAARLRRTGLSHVVLEKAGGIGGTWRENTYPGAGCDVPSHLYSFSGFPNFFMLYGPNTNLGSNSIIFMLEAQIGYVAGALAAMRRHRIDWVDVRDDVQSAFNRWVEALSRRTVWETGCHSWYTTAGKNTNNWPTYPFRYRRQLRRFDLRDYRVRRPAPAGP
jgi:cation diffusion facilitator CzcD-associated flavoprotein CzcO